MAYVRFGSKAEGDSPRGKEELLTNAVSSGVVVPIKTLVEQTEEPEPEPEPTRKTPGVTDSLPHAFRASRKLYPAEVEYAREIFGPSLRYERIRITRDHWFSYGSTRVVGNTVNFTSFYGDDALFEDTPEEHLTDAGLDLLGHELMHVWQYQNGGWAYAGDALFKQAAGYYSTGSRNTAYDWQTAFDWELPWEQWGPEQQAQAVDDWNLAKRGKNSSSGAAVHGGKKLVKKLQPFVEKVQCGEGATKFSIPGTLVTCSVLSGVGYLWKGLNGASCGAALGVLANLPWNHWYLKKPGLNCEA